MKHQISIAVNTEYLPNESSTTANRFVFAYTVTITNDGEIPARLISRHWIITDANNRVQEVKGEGVVGEQPYLEPGKSFQYTSGTVFETPVGTMEGSYHMVADDGSEFDARIPVFSFSLPGTLH
ncbi:MAG: Co2+/Mg2+ efflux protein ApaG [Gammaproteobacteria bacterium]|nr:Co2+/Mg2+ efflux protein ApaG [Gammaproteobacteria bacterium]